MAYYAQSADTANKLGLLLLAENVQREYYSAQKFSFSFFFHISKAENVKILYETKKIAC